VALTAGGHTVGKTHGNGNAKKSMVMAKDIADLITNLEGESGIYNLTDGYHPSFKELEVKIGRFYNKKIIAIPNMIAIILAKVGDLMGNKAPKTKNTSSNVNNSKS
jgi:nucleoside-diphosphate-sugar epimerase